MNAITATEFAKSFGRYKEEAQREPVAITSYGRISGYFVSAREYEELRRLREFERRVYRLKGLPKGINLFSLHAADGTPLALTDTRQAAIGHAIDDDLEIASVH